MDSPPEEQPGAWRTFRIIITPHFNNKGASHLSVHLILQTLKPSSPSTPLLLYETIYGNVPSNPYTPSDITAFDSFGPLTLTFTNSRDANSPDQDWHPDRETVGTIHIHFTVHPRQVDISTPIGPRVDLRYDQGGLIGNGGWFLPRPAEAGTYRNVVVWDLSHAPPVGETSTRAIWSFGEGPEAVAKIGGNDVLANSVFMVGPVGSFPSPSPFDGGTSSADFEGLEMDSRANIYWFGDLPENLHQFNELNVQLFPQLAGFFACKDASYRIFIRRVIRGFGGGACLDSYVLEYDESSWKEEDDELASLMAHEMVHSFVMMGAEGDGYENGWFIEDEAWNSYNVRSKLISTGIAELYCAYLPYRFGLRGIDYLRDRLNAFLQAYRTSPAIEMDVLRSQKDFFDNWYAELIPYMRGCAYLLQIDSRLRKMKVRFGLHQNSPLDDILIDMGTRFRMGEKLQASDWLEYLRPYLGEVVDQEFEDMLRDKVLNLRDVIVIHESWNLTPAMHEILEFGFDKSSINERVISGVVPGSRAARAGLEDGMRLLSMSRAGMCSTSMFANLELSVEHDGLKQKIAYWPRSFNKARVWQLEWP